MVIIGSVGHPQRRRTLQEKALGLHKIGIIDVSGRSDGSGRGLLAAG
jgi:hypothetical protein